MALGKQEITGSWKR